MISISFLSLLTSSCKKETLNKPEALAGGKGGDYHIALFSTVKGKGVPSRIFIKYASDRILEDTVLADEKFPTMTEPGFGPHAHFNNLTQGYYSVYISNGTLNAHYLFHIDSNTPKSKDYYIELN